MARKRKSNRKRNQKRPISRSTLSNAASRTGPGACSQSIAEDSEQQESWYSEAWADSRAGARAGRGFHFQDAVGAWLASRLASGDLAIDSLTPEGFDDLQLDTADPVYVQVKSRQGRLGSFRAGEAARHIVDAWARHSQRFGASGRIVVVLEHGIAGWESVAEEHCQEILLACLVSEVDGLADSLASRLETISGVSAGLDDLIQRTSILPCTWNGIEAEMACNLSQVVQLPQAGLSIVGRALLSIVADASDANAEADFDNRVSLDRTGVINEVNSVADLIDTESIEKALAEGVCSVIDWEPAQVGDAYYEGLSTQPGHVSADLVVARPDLVTQVMASLDTGQAVLLVGPSGVGKSAALWTLPQALPGVLWFRVHRLSDADISLVMKLLRAHSPSAKSPVGLLVDGAGRDDLNGWSRLQQAIATIPGVLLAGTARNEDLFPMGSLEGCVLVEVELDEAAAEMIHTGLYRRGSTTIPHWKEAFEESQGLTLEFTHMLTQGTRLQDVIRDQVNSRIREDRSLEFDILALAAVADRWSASLSVGKLEAALGVGKLELRAALARLESEHLLVEHDGVISGIHQVRSKGIVDAVHAIPPPMLKETALTVLDMLSGQVLSRFICELLRDQPELEAPIVQELKAQVCGNTGRLIECLRGLDILDFYRLALTWTEVTDRHEVPASQVPLVLHFAIAGIELPESFPVELRIAAEEIASLPEPTSTLDVLIREVGMAKIGEDLAEASTVESCLSLLRALSPTTLDCEPLLAALQPNTPLVSILKGCSVGELGECISSARDISPNLARAFVEAVGGTDDIIWRLRDSNPWIQRLDIDTLDGELVGVARFLHISDHHQGDPQERSDSIGRQLLRTLPDIGRVDVMGVIPNGRSLTINGVDHGISKLLRQYDYRPDAIERNQDKIRLVHTLFRTSETERLTLAARLLAEVAELVRDYGNMFVRSPKRIAQVNEMLDRCASLSEKGRLLPPQPRRFTPSPSDGKLTENGALPELLDCLSALVTSICGNVLPRLVRDEEHRSLSAFINETILGKIMPSAKRQPWRLLGSEDYPIALDDISKGLSELDLIIRELIEDLSSYQILLNATRRVSARSALTRASQLAQQRTQRRLKSRRKVVEKELQSTEWIIEIFWFEGDLTRGESSNFAVAVHVTSLVEWLGALQALVPKLLELRKPEETPLIFPTLNGRSVPLCARKLVFNLYPVNDLCEFESLVPQPIEEQLTVALTTAHGALQLISGLSALGSKDGLPLEARQLLELAQHEFKSATETVRALGDDELVSGTLGWLIKLEKQVMEEMSGETKAGAFASNVIEGLTGSQSQEAEDLESALLLSLHWDSDPATAVVLLRSLSG